MIGAAAEPVPVFIVPGTTGVDETASQSIEDFLQAVNENNVAFVTKDKRRTDKLNFKDGTRGQTAVHIAVKHHDCEILKNLVDKGAYLDLPDRDGVRPLAEAIREDNLLAVEILVKAKDRQGRQCLDLHQIITVTQNGLLHEAAWYDRIQIAKELLATGKYSAHHLNESNKMGQSTLHIAALRASDTLVQMLVDAGANPDAVTTNKRVVAETPQKIAEGGGKKHNAELLRSLSVATSSVAFAIKMKRKGAAAAAAGDAVGLAAEAAA